MITYSILFIISVFFLSTYGFSIGTVSDKNNVTKEANAADLFPDWVPFKNKHGDELGEFLPVQAKNKVKKRLAPPINFILRNLEPDSEYYDKGGDSPHDNADYFENKDWSDLSRPDPAIDKPAVVNHTELSDIDGVVNILTTPPNTVFATLNPRREKKLELEIIPKIVPDEPMTVEPTTIAAATTTTANESGEDYNDADEEDGGVEKSQANPKPDPESEARKAKILSAVDELKSRHAAEQRAISERQIEEETFNRNFESRDEVTERPIHRRRRVNLPPPDYDEYEDKNTRFDEKYETKPLLRHRPEHSTTTEPVQRKTRKSKPTKRTAAGKVSLFKNPQLFILYDDEDSSEATKPPKFSSRYTTKPSVEEDERISLIPEDSKEGEPTLFLPIKRKNKRFKIQTTTSAYDPETTAFDTTASDTKVDITAADSQLSDVKTGEQPTAGDSTGPDEDTSAIAGDTTGADTDAVTDAVPASSDHEKKEPKDYHNEKGGGREHHSEDSEEHEEHGKKAYEGHHEDTKTAKGHHDKEDHLGKYDDHGGVDKHHHEETGHYGKHHHEEQGKKHAKYEESGKHSKGHSTKGSHDIHKKEEYEKKVEFFEEEGDSGEEEKHGGYNQEKEHKKGGHFKNGNLKAGHHEHSKGDAGHYNKGGSSHVHKGHKLAAGHDSHGKNGHHHFQKGGNAGGKKWVYHHGTPAKTANLVVIDRRGDQFIHGPYYFGHNQ